VIKSIVSFFTSGGIGAIERIASEVIETDKESAEAKALWIKTLDPNGIMRRQLSSFASRAYGFYLISTTILIFLHAYGIGEGSSSKEAMEAMTALFMPITTAWGAIVGASFGVNGINASKRQ
jgi:hypothetical protein